MNLKTKTNSREKRSQKKSLEKRKFEQLAISSICNIITAIEPVPPRNAAAMIYVNKIPWKLVAKPVIKTLHLQVGQEFQGSALKERVTYAETRFAMEAALNLFSYRVRSEHEVRERLARKNISAPAIESVVGKLRKSGYLDDAAFLKAWVAERIDIKGFGRQRIKNELLAKGFDRETIVSELLKQYPEEREIDVAHKTIFSRLGQYDGLDKEVKRRRATQFLLRRGYSSAVTYSVLNKLIPPTSG